ncbi:hypothetical protein SNEBB_009345 [Seison nebaliae]|nr:hypothetical protein SNEBB_009345 [Seison nebaliae]
MGCYTAHVRHVCICRRKKCMGLMSQLVTIGENMRRLVSLIRLSEMSKRKRQGSKSNGDDKLDDAHLQTMERLRRFLRTTTLIVGNVSFLAHRENIRCPIRKQYAQYEQIHYMRTLRRFPISHVRDDEYWSSFTVRYNQDGMFCRMKEELKSYLDFLKLHRLIDADHKPTDNYQIKCIRSDVMH